MCSFVEGCPKMLQNRLSIKACLKESKIGKGIFAILPIARGETVIDLTHAPAKFFSKKEMFAYAKEGPYRHFVLQMGDDLFYAPIYGVQDADHYNHSCDPNCGFKESLTIVAMRDIAAGEELTVDYAMADSFAYYQLKCRCGSPACRGVVTYKDWKNPVLQEKYKDYFSDYIKKKIKWGPFQRFAHDGSDFFWQKLHSVRRLAKKLLIRVDR